MATTLTVDTDGVSGNYSTIKSALAATPNPLTDNYIIECAATTGVSDLLDSRLDIFHDTTINYTLTIQPTIRHIGVWNSSNYIIESNSSGNYVFVNGGAGKFSNVIFDGIQIYQSITNNINQNLITIGDTHNGEPVIKNCLIRGSNNESLNSRFITFKGLDYGAKIFFINNLVFDVQRFPNSYQNVVFSTSTGASPNKVYMYNNTIIGGSYLWAGGFSFLEENILFINNLIDTEQWIGGTGWDTNSDYNSTSVNIAFAGTHDRKNQTFTFLGGDDYHLDPDDEGALGFGTSLTTDNFYPFSTDLEGEERGNTWDIGADEYIEKFYKTGSGIIDLTGSFDLDFLYLYSFVGSGLIEIFSNTSINSIIYEKPFSEIYKDIYGGESFTSLQEDRVITETEVSYYDLFLRGGS